MQFAFGQVMATEESRDKLRHSLEIEAGQMATDNPDLFHEPSHLGRAVDPGQKKSTGVSIGDIEGV